MAGIDAHQHIIPAGYKAALARLGVAGSGENAWPSWSASEAIDLMGNYGIDGAITSVASPGIHFGDIGATRDLARVAVSSQSFFQRGEAEARIHRVRQSPRQHRAAGPIDDRHEIQMRAS